MFAATGGGSIADEPGWARSEGADTKQRWEGMERDMHKQALMCCIYVFLFVCMCVISQA